MNLQSHHPVIHLMGPTASGKTALALALARRFPLEIISVDSALVYRGLNIGTAKPSVEERAEVPHHLVDICEPEQAYSAAKFTQDARALIEAIHLRGRVPLLVGGTMLYFKALNDGLDDMPAADPNIRARLDAEAVREGWPALHRRLAQVDALTAARLAPQDAQRIQRALEIFELTGQPLSAFHSAKNRMPQPATGRFLRLALMPHDRPWLHERITQRFDSMLAAGLVDEVRSLRARGDLQPNLPSMRTVGYRQVWEYLDGKMASLAECRERSLAATRQLAKRQMTWLRSMPVDLSVEPQHGLEVVNVVQSFMDRIGSVGANRADAPVE